MGSTVKSSPPLRGEVDSDSWCAYGQDRDGWALPDAGICAVAEELHLCIVVFGATGDLAEKKTFPSLASLYNRGYVYVSRHAKCHLGQQSPDV